MNGSPPLDFASVYAEHYPRVVRYLRRMVGEAEAEDVAQAAFIRVGAALPGFRGDAALSTWVFRIATNVAVDRLRTRPPRFPCAPDPGPLEGAADQEAESSVEESCIRLEMNACIRELVDNLPGAYRPALVLADLEGFSNAEIGDILGLTLDTVKIRLHRGRRLLRQAMDRHCSFYRHETRGLCCDRRDPEPETPDGR